MPILRSLRPRMLLRNTSLPPSLTLNPRLRLRLRLRLRRITTTAAGTAYEHLTLNALRSLGFTLTHVGGRSDKGIDLLGSWAPPAGPAQQANHDGSSDAASASPGHETARSVINDVAQAQERRLNIPVLVQCKAVRRATPHPAWVRELEGAMAGVPVSFLRQFPSLPNAENKGKVENGDTKVMGVLVAVGKASPGIRQAVMAARHGVIWIQVTPDGEPEANRDTDEEDDGADSPSAHRGSVQQVLWNKHVSALVGQDLGAGYVYRSSSASEGKLGQVNGVEREVRLFWRGRVWVPPPTPPTEGS